MDSITTKYTPEQLTSRLSYLRDAIEDEEDVLRRLDLIQERIDLVKETEGSIGA